MQNDTNRPEMKTQIKNKNYCIKKWSDSDLLADFMSVRAHTFLIARFAFSFFRELNSIFALNWTLSAANGRSHRIHKMIDHFNFAALICQHQQQQPQQKSKNKKKMKKQNLN